MKIDADAIRRKVFKVKIDPCPTAGEGVNRWVNLHVLRMLKAGYTDSTIYQKLLHIARGCGRDIRKDITHSIDTGRQFLGIGKGFGLLGHDPDEDEIDTLRNLPPLEAEYQQFVIQQNQSVTLREFRSIRMPNTMQILWDLFGKNRICIGYSRYHSAVTSLTNIASVVRFRNSHTKLGLCQFIVPSPMVGDYALNKSGRRAIRCLNNTCQRWFLVIEFDHLTSQDDQIRLHYELAKENRLRMLIYSGNKSIHGWYDVFGQPEKESKNLMKIATRLGADPMTWIRCQYVRFPNGINEKTKEKQEVLFYQYE